MSEERTYYDAGRQPDRLEQIRARLEAVPELPDYVQYSNGSWGVWTTTADGTRIRIAKITVIAKVTAGVYAQLFAHAPADIAYLLSEVESWKSHVIELTKTLEVVAGTGE